MAGLSELRADASQVALLLGARLMVLRRAGRSRPWLTTASLLATAAAWAVAIVLSAFVVERVAIAMRVGADAEVGLWVHAVHTAVFLLLLLRPLFAGDPMAHARRLPDHIPVSDRTLALVDWLEEALRPLALGVTLPAIGVAWMASDGPLRGVAAVLASLAMGGLAMIAGRRLRVLRDELAPRARAHLVRWLPALTGLAVGAAVMVLGTERLDPVLPAEFAERAVVLPSWWSATVTLGRPLTALGVGLGFPLIALWLVPTTLAAEARLRRRAPLLASSARSRPAIRLVPAGVLGALLEKDLRIAARDPTHRIVRAQWPAYLAASLVWAWGAGDVSAEALRVQAGLLGLGMVLLRLPLLSRPFDADGAGLVGLLAAPVSRIAVARAKWFGSVIATLPSVVVAVTCGALLVAWRQDASGAIAALGAGLLLAVPALVLASAVGTWASARFVLVAPVDGTILPVLQSAAVVLGVAVVLVPLVFVAHSGAVASTGLTRFAAWGGALLWSLLVSLLAASAAARELRRREEELSACGTAAAG